MCPQSMSSGNRVMVSGGDRMCVCDYAVTPCFPVFHFQQTLPLGASLFRSGCVSDQVLCCPQDLSAYKKQGIALLTRVGESVKHVTGGYKLRSRPLEFTAIGEYLDTFALKLGTIDRIAQWIIKEEIGELIVETDDAWGGMSDVLFFFFLIFLKI